MKWELGKTIPVLLACGAVSSFLGPAWGQTRQFQFEQFPAKVYHGRIHIPAGMRKDKEGSRSYSNWKPAMPPGVTFAGEYDLAGISCGTECRYYQLTNLRTGVKVPASSMFDGGEELPVTRDGHPYLTILYYKPNSRLLIAEYLLDFRDPDKPQTCRQRYFVLDYGKLHPISKIFPFCTEERER